MSNRPRSIILNLIKKLWPGFHKKPRFAHGFHRTFQRLEELHALGLRPNTICDVGASKGTWTRRCLQIFPQAQYFCVDPLEENLPHLAKLSAKYPNVLYWQGCLGPQSGPDIMNVDGDGSSILPGHFGNPYGTQREVMVETLDELVAREICQQPELIKLDVQGYELEVLRGARKALAGTQAVIAEVSFFPFQTGMPVFHEVVGQMARWGFVVSDILSLSARPLDGAAGQTDVLFLKEAHPMRGSSKWDHNSMY